MKNFYEKLLKGRSLSLTSVRLALLKVLTEHPHSDVNFIYKKVQAKIVTASKQAIYNNLSMLVEHKLIREIKPKGHLSLYETKTNDNHHHILCRSCHLVVDSDCKTSAPCLTPVDDKGFFIDEAEVIFWGICPSCQTLNLKTGDKK